MDQKAESAGDENDLSRRLAIAIRAAELGIWQWDLRADTFVFSDRAKAIFGFDRNEPVTRDRIIAVLHPDDHLVAREQAVRGLDPSLQKREPYRYRIHRANDGELRWIQAFGEPVFETVDGKPVAVRYIGTLQDVTEEILVKEELVRQQARLRLAIEVSGVAVWEVNVADQTVTHSPELNRLCGFPPDAQPSLEEFRSRYAPGERERMERLAAETWARGDTKLEAEIRHLWPDGTEKWLSLRAQLAPGETGYGGRVIGVLVDITEQKKREEQQALLLSEFKHRIKNAFAITQSIVDQTLRAGDVAQEVRAKLAGRLRAMADAHDLIAKGAWEGAGLTAVLDRAIAAFDGHASGRIEVQADDLELTPRAALSFSLLLHELFTNAVKYGSLSNPTGRIRIGAGREESGEAPLLKFEWTERGGPPPRQPLHSGFGTRLTDRVFCTEFDAVINRELGTEGLWFEMKVPIVRLAQDGPGA